MIVNLCVNACILVFCSYISVCLYEFYMKKAIPTQMSENTSNGDDDDTVILNNDEEEDTVIID